MPKGFFTFQGRCPDGVPGADFRLAKQKVSPKNKHLTAHQFSLVSGIPTVLEEPWIIFQGLGRPNFEEAYCYVGKPDVIYLQPEISTTWNNSFYLLVFISSSLEVLKWRQERFCDTDEFGVSASEKRFGKVLWKNSEHF